MELKRRLYKRMRCGLACRIRHAPEDGPEQRKAIPESPQRRP